MPTGSVPDAEEQAKRHQLQERVERGVRADLAEVGSHLKWDPGFNDQALEQVLEAFKASQPTISDKDVERIADRMGDRYIELVGHEIGRGRSKKRARERARNRARNIAWGVTTGLITTGAVDLITYLAHSGGALFAPASEDAAVSKRTALERERDERIQARLLAGLPDTILRSFVRDSALSRDLGEVLSRRLVEIVRDTELIDDLVDIRPWPDGRPIAVTAFVSDLWYMIAYEVACSVEPRRSNDAESPHD